MVLDPEEMAELLDENVLERAISEEMPELTLSEEEKGDLLLLYADQRHGKYHLPGIDRCALPSGK